MKNGLPIQSLDDEIDLFNEEEWNFMDVIDGGRNYEYYDDILDDDFLKKKGVSFSWIGFALVLTVMISGISLLVNVTGVFRHSSYDELLSMSNVNDGASITEVEGVEVSSEELLQVSETINRYFNCVRMQSDYAELYTLCSTTSSFADVYYQTTSKVESLYDSNDCYARALRKFGSFCSPGKISKVIESDGVYYCYLQFSYPSITDITEYINLYSYNMTKFFGSHELEESNIIRFLMDTAEVNPMSCHSENYCIRLVEKDGVFKIVNDSFLTDICTDAYSNTIMHVTNTLKGTLVTSI